MGFDQDLISDSPKTNTLVKKAQYGKISISWSKLKRYRKFYIGLQFNWPIITPLTGCPNNYPLVKPKIKNVFGYSGSKNNNQNIKL